MKRILFENERICSISFWRQFISFHTVNVLKIQALYSILFWLEFCLKMLSGMTNSEDPDQTAPSDCLFVLRFYGPVNPMGSCRARSVYLTTRLLGRLSPLSG